MTLFESPLHTTSINEKPRARRLAKWQLKKECTSTDKGAFPHFDYESRESVML
jgi:hypothetical protein